MKEIQQHLMLMTHAVVITLLMFWVPNLSIPWNHFNGDSGLRNASEATSDKLYISLREHLWNPLIASLHHRGFSGVRDRIHDLSWELRR